MVKMGNALSEMWRWIVIIMLPSIATIFRVNCYNQKAEKWFTSLMRRLIGSRKGQETEAEDKDILSTLMKIHEEDPNELDETAIEKTMLQFIFDGYNTTSDACTGVFAFIATHPEVLEKLREEIDAVFDAKEDGDIDVTDTDVMGMNYLDCIISEQQRLVAVSVTSRRVTKPWTIPGTNLTLPVGVSLYIPIGSFQKDPESWENPLEFNPERFNAENKNKIKTGTYAPLGLGPRKCLGSNYAILTIKFILIYLIRFFDVENCENLPKNFELDPNALGLPKGGIRVKFHKREF
jgi:cytochrome P450